MKIKVCGMREASNLLELMEISPDFVGFIFYPGSPRDVMQGDVLTSAEVVVTKALPTQRVGVFVNATQEEILSATASAGLDFVQLHGDESPGFCANIAGYVPVIKAFRIGTDFDFTTCEAYQRPCDLFVFDAKGLRYGGNGTKFDWGLLDQYQGETPFLLSGGIGPADVEELLALDHPRLAGVDLNSGFESAPGQKDIPKLKAFAESLRHNSISTSK